MSTSIGFGYKTRDGNNLFHDLKVLAEKFGYGLLNGIERSESDVRSGLSVALKNQGWTNLVFLQSPRDNNVALAWGIHEELIALEVSGKPPPIF